jgi:short-subunit dehydrogenase
MPRRCLSDSVVVITGASSGIGRAAARAFAERGATVVVAARREAPLREVVEECHARGARALAMPTDVTDREAVEQLARRAIASFGRIDVWVNNAAVSLFARFEETPFEEYRGVIETNLFGYIHGARAVLPHFREQGSGVLINNASIVAYVGQPYTSAYVLSKFAIRGLGECLRQELRDAPGIHISTLLPASTDTPIFQHAANHTGRAIKPMDPVYDARIVAETIVRLAERPRREAFAGRAGRLLAWQKTLTPGLTEGMVARLVETNHFQAGVNAPRSSGNVQAPAPGWTGVSGGWARQSSRSALKRLLFAGLALAVVPMGAIVASRWGLAQGARGEPGLSVGDFRRKPAHESGPGSSA